ncbi:unnamed protein product [Cylicocyclus nassatus]|uniref:Uncharacterized protein n=1 Tax=Cylicocyclus nassatus TaxID=53992 RepID=A0AA36DM03_CYLNA|nr:unnamed protein product [Cylicocyclus nassatus]
MREEVVRPDVYNSTTKPKNLYRAGVPILHEHKSSHDPDVRRTSTYGRIVRGYPYTLGPVRRPLQLQLWTREKITTVPRVNNSNDSATVDPGDRVEVDVLIGIDNYWRIVDLHRNEKLPSGLILSHTRFGPVLSGLQHSTVSNSLSATTTSDKDEPESEQVMRNFLGLDTLELDEGEDTENAGVIRQFYDTVAIVDANRLKEEILANTYVDNVIVGAGSTEECLNKCKQCKDIFARMCMNLREFMSNDSSTMLSIPEHDRMNIQGHFVKLLGVK